jgi:type IV secretion system protein VirD4
MLSRTIGDTIEYETVSTSRKTSWFDSPDHSTSVSGLSPRAGW